MLWEASWVTAAEVVRRGESIAARRSSPVTRVGLNSVGSGCLFCLDGTAVWCRVGPGLCLSSLMVTALFRFSSLLSTYPFSVHDESCARALWFAFFDDYQYVCLILHVAYIVLSLHSTHNNNFTLHASFANLDIVM